MKQVPMRNNCAVFSYFLVISIDSISFGLIAPILAPLLTHSSIFFPSHLSVFFHYCLYGLMISLFPLTYMIGAPILGILSDRFGRKKVLIYCLLITLLSFLGYAGAFLYKSINLFISARILSGLSAGSQGVAQAGVIDFATKNEKPFYISFMAVGMTIGLILGPMAASLWTHTASWVPFALVFLLGVLGIIFLQIFANDNRNVFTHFTSKNALKKFLTKTDMTRLLLLFLLFELGWSMFYQTLPLWVSIHWKLKNPQLGFINSYVGALLAICLLCGTRWGLRFFSLQRLIQYGFCMGALALLFLFIPASLFLFLLLIFPIVLTVAIVYPSLITQLSEIGGIDNQGLLMGISDTLLAFSFTVTGFISSILTYFNPTLPFVVSALCWGIAILFSITYQDNRLCSSVST